MTEKLKHWLTAAFLLMVVSLLFWFKLSQPRVLVIQSYDADYGWTREVDAGLRRVLNGRLQFKVQWHYMDLRKHPGAEFGRKAGTLAVREIERFRPDVIIAIDDGAQKYAVKQYAGRPGVSIVFGGVNGSVEPYGYPQAPNVTGIYERKPLINLRRTLDAMRDAEGKPLGRRMVHLGDRSDNVAVDAKDIEGADWSPFRLVASKRLRSFDEWKQAVEEASAQADFIILTNYQYLLRKDGEKDLVPSADVVAWTESNSRVPVIGTNNFMVEDGGMLAVGTSGFEQGEACARMALRILEEGTPPAEIPYAKPRQFLVYMRQGLMEKRGLKLPDVYEAFSRALNNYR